MILSEPDKIEAVREFAKLRLEHLELDKIFYQVIDICATESMNTTKSSVLDILDQVYLTIHIQGADKESVLEIFTLEVYKISGLSIAMQHYLSCKLWDGEMIRRRNHWNTWEKENPAHMQKLADKEAIKWKGAKSSISDYGL